MIVTGLQPTGSIHIGNLLGAIKPLIALQRPAVSCAAFIADYHAITSGHDPVALRENSLKLAAMMIASGFDHAKHILFKQSAVPAHTELGWILMSTAARMGWLNRMVQFREKSNTINLFDVRERVTGMVNAATAGNDVCVALLELRADLKKGLNSEGPSVGLFSYPVLQAADILLYQADEVPVGEDQSQHLNLAVDIAEKFNLEYGPIFTVPRAVVSPSVKRIMSLTDPTKKMSKSEPNMDSRINLDDSPDDVARKIKRATTDQALIPATVEELEGRPGLTNLLTIYGAFTGLTAAEALERFGGAGYGVFKPALTEVIREGLRPIQKEYRVLMDDRATLQMILDRGANNAATVADPTLHAVRRAIGVM